MIAHYRICTQHAGADGEEEVGDLVVAGGRGRVEADAARRLIAEHPVEGQGVEVDIQ